MVKLCDPVQMGGNGVPSKGYAQKDFERLWSLLCLSLWKTRSWGRDAKCSYYLSGTFPKKKKKMLEKEQWRKDH